MSVPAKNMLCSRSLEMTSSDIFVAREGAQIKFVIVEAPGRAEERMQSVRGVELAAQHAEPKVMPSMPQAVGTFNVQVEQRPVHDLQRLH